MVKLFLDDIRVPKDEYDYVARSYSDAVHIVRTLKRIPNFISFDHDLGDTDELSGYDFAKWLVSVDLDGQYLFPSDFSFNVHSANPVGAENILSLLNNYLRTKECK